MMNRERRLTRVRTARRVRSRKKAYLQRRGVERFPDAKWYAEKRREAKKIKLRGVKAEVKDLPKNERKRPVRAFFQRLFKRGVR